MLTSPTTTTTTPNTPNSNSDAASVLSAAFKDPIVKVSTRKIEDGESEGRRDSGETVRKEEEQTERSKTTKPKRRIEHISCTILTIDLLGDL